MNKGFGVPLLVMALGACSKAKQPPAAGSGSASGSAAGSAAVVAASAGVAGAQDAAIVATGSGASDAGVDAPVAAVPCEVAALKQARKSADALVKAGKADDAAALLSHIDCYLEADGLPALNDQIAWIVSDLAFAYYKAGKPEACYTTAYSETMPYSGNVADVFDETSSVVKAIAYNAELCRKAVDKKLGVFVLAKECGESCYGLPDGSSLQIGPSSKDSDDLNVCGTVSLVIGKQKTELTVTEGNLSDSSTCCNVDAIGFQKRGTGWAVQTKSEGRDCNGGTASSSEQHVYVLKAKELELEHTLNATHH